MRRRQFADAFIDRQRGRHVIVRKVLAQGVQIQIRSHRRVGQQHFRLRREQERAVEHAPVQRLFTKPIARDEQSPALLVPQCEREHAVQMRDHILAVFFIKMWQDFGV